MVQRKGMLGLVRFRILRAGISKYSTLRLVSRVWLWAASLAIPTSAMGYFRLLFAFWQGGNLTSLELWLESQDESLVGAEMDDNCILELCDPDGFPVGQAIRLARAVSRVEPNLAPTIGAFVGLPGRKSTRL